MGRSRYKIYEPIYPHLITCIILHWIPIFTRTETTNIVFDSLKFLQKEDNLKIYAYVILENHHHMIVSYDDVSKTIKKFKSFTAKEILKYLQIKNIKTILEQIAFYKKAHKIQTTYQLWQEGFQPKLIKGEKMMIETINYIHHRMRIEEKENLNQDSDILIN
ncbi:MAG: transposase [Aliarcobacter sp.]|jgi:REP element-mobilizing transposase RayT|nr:transposase [Aliarcobacter sp.]